MLWFKQQHKTVNYSNGNTSNGTMQAFLVLDVSGSMGTSDLKPTRLDGAKNASFGYVEQLRQACPDATVSVISYGSDAKIECKALSVSENYSKICKSIKYLRTRGATDIGRGLRKAENLLKSQNTSALVHVVLLSDGGHNGTVNPVPVADNLKRRWQARIDCIGIGSSPGSVDEKLMRRIASLDENRKPRYHFIRDSFELLEHFKNIAGYLAKS